MRLHKHPQVFQNMRLRIVINRGHSSLTPIYLYSHCLTFHVLHAENSSLQFDVSYILLYREHWTWAIGMMHWFPIFNYNVIFCISRAIGRTCVLSLTLMKVYTNVWWCILLENHHWLVIMYFCLTLYFRLAYKLHAFYVGCLNIKNACMVLCLEINVLFGLEYIAQEVWTLNFDKLVVPFWHTKQFCKVQLCILHCISLIMI